MNILTLLGFLVGRRDCIEAFARSPYTLWIGAVFVLSAGFAREYDDEDLLREPWHLALPFLASTATALALYGLVAARRPSLGGMRQALGLFWLTAPMAWLYAIPYERFLSPEDAITANLFTLALVAAWRVLLIVRVLGVVGPTPWYGVLGAVAIVCFIWVSGAVALDMYANIRVIDHMGGLDIKEEIAAPTLTSGLLRIVWGIAAVMLVLTFPGLVLAIARGPREWQFPEPSSTPIAWSLRGLLIASLVVWLFILPFTQAEQYRAQAIDLAIAEKRYADAAEMLRRWPRGSLPPRWRPGPPALDLRNIVEASKAIVAMKAEELPEWAASWYDRRFWWLFERTPVLYILGKNELAVILEMPDWWDWLQSPAENANSYEEMNRSDFRALLANPKFSKHIEGIAP